MIRGSRGRADSDNSSSKERRGARRYPFKASAYVVDAESNARVISRASDLNLGGCRVDAVTCLPVGSAVWLRLTQAGQSFTTKAKVVAARDEIGMNLAFASTEPEQLWVVKKWVDELRQEECPAAEQVDEQQHEAIDAAFEREPNEILKYLILMLVQKSVLDEAEGSVLLRRLLSA
jgi:PilZ domain